MNKEQEAQKIIDEIQKGTGTYNQFLTGKIGSLVGMIDFSEKPPTTPPKNQAIQEIMSRVENAVMTQNEILEKERTGPKWGRLMSAGENPNGLNPWWVRTGDSYEDTTIQGAETYEETAEMYPHTAIKTPQVGGIYQYLDNYYQKRVTVQNMRRWGHRLHGVRKNVLFNGSIVRNIRDEHGHYISVVGLDSLEGLTTEHATCVTWNNCGWANIAGQAIQVVQRDQIGSPNPDLNYDHETPDPSKDFSPGLPLVGARLAMYNVSQPGGGRQSFNMSFFHARNNVRLDTVLIDNRMQTESRGFLMAYGYEDTQDNFERALTARNFVFRSSISKQQAMLFEGMSHASLTNGVIDVPEGTNRFLDFNGCKKINVSNVWSLGTPVHVRIDGEDKGPVDGMVLA